MTAKTPSAIAARLSACLIPILSLFLVGFRNDDGSQAGAAILIILIIGIYILPTIIAITIGHPAAMGIGLLNLTLGWTGIIWVVVFIWACIKPGKPVTVLQQSFPSPAPPQLPAKPRLEEELEALQRLKERNLITEEEFMSRRRSLLSTL